MIEIVYLYLDREFNLVENMSGSLMADEVGILGALAIERMQAERDGFMYIFVVNETTTAIDFDNLIVIHKTGTVLEINDYYPFGLKWYSNGTKLNKYKFGGKELQTELNLNTYDFLARQQDPQLGRFWGVDPMGEKRLNLSSFNYVQNNPVRRVDPTGMLDNDGWHVDENSNVKYNSAKTEEEFVKLGIKGDWIANEFTLDNVNGTKTDFLANGDMVNYNGFELTAVGEKITNNWLQDLQTGLGTIDIGFGTIGLLTNFATSEVVGKSINKLERLDYVSAMGKSGANMSMGLKYTGYATFAVSSTISLNQMSNYYNNGGTNNSVWAKTALDIGMGGVGFIGWQGFAVSTSYFLIESGTNGFGGWGNPLTTPK